jgi:trehalose 6-phosphate synthase
MVIPDKDQESMAETMRKEYSAVPIYLDEDTAEKHYNGFSNSILWYSPFQPYTSQFRTRTLLTTRPLFHYHPGEIHFDEANWDAYRQANLAFANRIAEIVEDGDLIWVQDYHLMVLPRLLRQAIGKSKKDIKIGFFLHTPFPSSEIYRYHHIFLFPFRLWGFGGMS